MDRNAAGSRRGNVESEIGSAGRRSPAYGFTPFNTAARSSFVS